MNKYQNGNLHQNIIQKRKVKLFQQQQSTQLNLNQKSQLFHNFSQPKPRSNNIKVNKAKLPADFFPKYSSNEKKIPNFKLNFNKSQKSQKLDDRSSTRRAGSERLHDSPQKTSFFGLFEQSNTQQLTEQMGSTKKLSLNRKFQTRQQQKRDNSQNKRRFTPASHSHRNQIYQLFKIPINYQQQMNQIISSNINNNSSLARICKLSPRKQHISKYREQYQMNDSEKSQQNPQIKNKSSFSYIMQNSSLNYDIPSPTKKSNKINTIERNPTHLLNINQQQLRSNILDYTFAATGDTINLHNMTFYNVKSSCLPPIKRTEQNSK